MSKAKPAAVSEAKSAAKSAFKEDWRVSNPGLHLLYTRWAIIHLKVMA